MTMTLSHAERTAPAGEAGKPKTRRLHPLPLRIMHWTNALAMFIMIGSGWKIYEDEVLFGWLHFPDWITIGGEAQGALQWHFAAMWILMINGLVYLVLGFASGEIPKLPLNLLLLKTAAALGVFWGQ